MKGSLVFNALIMTLVLLASPVVVLAQEVVVDNGTSPLVGFLLSPEVLGVVAVVLVGMIAIWGRKWLNHFRVVFQVWHYVEKMGILANLKGYEKLALAMDVFQDRFYEQFGKEPKPGDEGWAVKILTWLCRLEDKEPIEDFFDEPTPPSNLENSGEVLA